MNEGSTFLHAFAQAIAAVTLYTPGHPATRRSFEQLWQVTSALLVADSHPVFLFLGTAPVYGGRALHELRDWHHSGRLSAIGVQRLELDSRATEESISHLVERIAARLGNPGGELNTAPIPGIAFGAVALEEQVEFAGFDAGDAHVGGEITLDLADELDAMHYIRDQAVQGSVARAEIDAVVRILAAVVERHRVPPSPRGEDLARRYEAHAVNTAIVAMTASRAAGLDGAAQHRLGVAALVHDIGLARLPGSLLDREAISDDERVRIEAHTTIGAELLLREGGGGFELAAVVAREHHMRNDGGGYPVRRAGIEPHWASRLVNCCSVFADVRQPRPPREAMSVERALSYLADGAGTAFDAELVALVTSAVRGD